MTDEQSRRLAAGLATLLPGVDTAREQDVLARYIDELELWNPRLGLLAPGEDIVGRHILDSLSGMPAIRELQPASLADIGSGAGFPGIPLAVFMPDCEFHLVERMGRRAGFLRNAVLMLGLTNVQVVEKPVEELKTGNLRFEVVTFRAWSALEPQVLDSMASILAPDGRIAAYKGRNEVIAGELAAVRGRIGEQSIIALENFSGEEERNLVVLRIRSNRST